MNRKQFDAAFLKHRADLVSYAFRICANRADAEDLVQYTYLKGCEHIEQFRGNSSLKTWLFAIATNTLKDSRRARKRWQEDTQDRCRATTQADQTKVAEMQRYASLPQYQHYLFEEHISYCFTCISKTLPIDQQVVLLLKEMFGFTIDEIAGILNIGRGKTKHALADGRKTMTDIFAQRCSLINKNGACYQCSEMSGFVNPRADAHRRALQTSLARASGRGRTRQELLDIRIALVRQLDVGEKSASCPGIHDYLLQLMEEEEA